jgi:hypothetical protein
MIAIHPTDILVFHFPVINPIAQMNNAALETHQK